MRNSVVLRGILRSVDESRGVDVVVPAGELDSPS